MLKNLKKGINRIAVHHGQYIQVGLYGYYSDIAVAANGRIILDTYYTLVSDLVTIVAKHTQLRYNKLSDLVVYDRPQYRMRFKMNIILDTSNQGKTELTLRCDGDAKVSLFPTISRIISAAAWAEREAAEAFGIKIQGSEVYQKLLGDYGNSGFPGRKDFPTGGRYVYNYSTNFSRVVRIRGSISDFWALFQQKQMIERRGLRSKLK